MRATTRVFCKFRNFLRWKIVGPPDSGSAARPEDERGGLLCARAYVRACARAGRPRGRAMKWIVAGGSRTVLWPRPPRRVHLDVLHPISTQIDLTFARNFARSLRRDHPQSVFLVFLREKYLRTLPRTAFAENSRKTNIRSTFKGARQYEMRHNCACHLPFSSLDFERLDLSPIVELDDG